MDEVISAEPAPKPAPRVRKQATVTEIKPAKRRGRPPKVQPPNIGNVAVPDFSEWQDFIGTLLIRWLCRAYVTVALRGGIQDMLTPEEKEDLELDDESLAAIAKPFASLAIRSKKFNLKYGRTIMDSRDAIESSVMLFMWAGRVSRIRTKYTGRHRKAEPDGNNSNVIDIRNEAANDEPTGQDVPQVASFASGSRPTGIGYN